MSDRMRYWCLYHNYDDLGYVPGGYSAHLNPKQKRIVLDTSEFELSCITSGKKELLGAVGDLAFLIVGFGKPKRYLLWSWVRIGSVEDGSDGRFDAFPDDGRVLNPPPELSGSDFDQFKKKMGNFGLGFQNISNSPFLDQLLELCQLTASEP